MTWQRPMLLIVSFFALCGCVSVNLKASEIKHSSGLRYQEPIDPFSRTEFSNIDAAWKNSRTGSIISVFSDCGDMEMSLEAMRDNVLRELAGYRLESETRLRYQGRDAIRAQGSGQVDGVDTTVDLLVLKKNGCGYVVTLVGGPRSLEQDRVAFNSFLAHLEAP